MQESQETSGALSQSNHILCMLWAFPTTISYFYLISSAQNTSSAVLKIVWNYEVSIIHNII